MIFNKNELDLLLKFVDDERLKEIELSHTCGVASFDEHINKVGELVTLKFKIENLQKLNQQHMIDKIYLKDLLDNLILLNQNLACEIVNLRDKVEEM